MQILCQENEIQIPDYIQKFETSTCWVAQDQAQAWAQPSIPNISIKYIRDN